MSAQRSSVRRPDAKRFAECDEDPEYAYAGNAPAPAVDIQSPEVALLLAVLQRTILDLGGRAREGHHRPTASRLIAQEAFEWVVSASSEVWSFVWVCDQLRVDEMWARAHIFAQAARIARQPAVRGLGRA